MDQEHISQRAYALWEKAGQPDGAHDEHWRQACQELEGEDGAAMAATTPVADLQAAGAAAAEGQHAPHPETAGPA